MTQTAATPAPHTRIEDAQAFALGTAMCALGVTMLTHLGLITGQTAGLAVLVSYGTGLSFGLVFFCVNLPFYWLAWLRMGPRFTFKSFGSIGVNYACCEIGRIPAAAASIARGVWCFGMTAR